MSNFSPDEARQLADDFSAAASMLSEYIATHPELSDEESDNLLGRLTELINAARRMRNSAVLIELEDAEKDLRFIREATKEATDAVKTIKKIGTVVQVVAGLVDFAVAIYKGDLRDIYKSGKKLVDIVRKEAKDEKKPAAKKAATKRGKNG